MNGQLYFNIGNPYDDELGRLIYVATLRPHLNLKNNQVLLAKVEDDTFSGVMRKLYIEFLKIKNIG